MLVSELGRVLLANEVAEYLRCSPSTVYRNFQLLGGCKIGRQYRFFEVRLIQALSKEELSSVTELIQKIEESDPHDLLV